MPTTTFPEFWLRGPVEGGPPLLQPAAHALLQAREEATSAARGLSPEQLWARPAGAAAAGFHLRHVAGVLDRLLTYARGEALSEAQLATLRREGVPGDPPEEVESLLSALDAAVERALAQLRATPGESILEPRKVGRAGLPSTVQGLLFHAAEHAQRHTGQLLVTARLARDDHRVNGE
jgi:uncharacterized damage-inducible protein DinB